MGFQSGERRWKKNPTRSRGKSRLIRQCEVGGCSTGDALLRVVDARRNAAPSPAREQDERDGRKSGSCVVGGRRRRVSSAPSSRDARRVDRLVTPRDPLRARFPCSAAAARRCARPPLDPRRVAYVWVFKRRCCLSRPAARRSRRPSSPRSPRSPSAARRPPHPRSARHPALDPRCARARATTPRARSRPTRRPRLARRASSSTATISRSDPPVRPSSDPRVVPRSPPTQPFGAAPAAGGFGAAPAAGGFGAPAAASSPTFGAAPAPATGGFGAPAPAASPGGGLFGAAPAAVSPILRRGARRVSPIFRRGARRVSPILRRGARSVSPPRRRTLRRRVSPGRQPRAADSSARRRPPLPQQRRPPRADFSFGAATAPAAAPSPAPATGGFSFGGAPAASETGRRRFAASPGGFSFEAPPAASLPRRAEVYSARRRRRPRAHPHPRRPVDFRSAARPPRRARPRRRGGGSGIFGRVQFRRAIRSVWRRPFRRRRRRALLRRRARPPRRRKRASSGRFPSAPRPRHSCQRRPFLTDCGGPATYSVIRRSDALVDCGGIFGWV